MALNCDSITNSVSRDDEFKWQNGSVNFHEFATSLDQESCDWLCCDDKCRSMNEADLQLLFLGERPATCLSTRVKTEMPDSLKVQLKRFGYEVFGRFVYDPNKMLETMKFYNLVDQFTNPIELLQKMRGMSESDQNYVSLMAIVLGYPLEATRRWQSKHGHFMDLFREYDDIEQCILNDPSNAVLAHWIRILKEESKVRQKARRIVESLVWSTVDDYAFTLEYNSARVEDLKQLFANYREITSIITPFTTWYDRGIPCKESILMSDRHNQAAVYSGIRYIRIQKSEPSV